MDNQPKTDTNLADKFKEILAKNSQPNEVVVKKTVSKEPITANEIRDRMTEIEQEFNGFSNIPINHEYWDLRNRHHAMRNK